MAYKKYFIIIMIFLLSITLSALSLEKNINISNKNFQSKNTLSKDEINYLKSNIFKIGMVSNYYPFSYKENKNMKGFSYEYFKLLASKVGLKYEIQINNWSNILDSFKNKEIDIIDTISYTKNRAEFTNFLNPYFELPNIIFSRKDNINEYKNLESLKGKKVGISKGIYYFDTIKDLGLFNLVVFENSREKLKALAYGEIDAVFDNLASAQKCITDGAYLNIDIPMPEKPLIQRLH